MSNVRKGADISQIVESLLSKKIEKSSIGKGLQAIDDIKDKDITLNISITGEDNIEKAREDIEKLLSSIKELSNYKSRAKYFQSIESAAENIKESWNELIVLINKTNFDKSKGLEGLFENKEIKTAALNVYKYANAFTALGGNVDEISSQIDEFVKKISSLQNKEGKNTYSASAGYLYDVDSFREIFELLKKIQSLGNDNIFEQLGLNVGNLQSVIDTTKKILDINQEYFNIQKQTTEAVTESYDQQAESIHKAVQEVEKLSQEQVKLEAISKYKQGRVYDDWDVDYDFNNSVSDVQKYAEALEYLKEKQNDALSFARMYQNDYADAVNSGIDNPYEYREMERYMEEYAKYTAQVEYVQRQLNEAVRNYDPSKITGSGATEQWIVIINLIKEVVEKLESLTTAIGEIPGEGKSLLTFIDEVSNSLKEVYATVQEISLLGTNVHIDMGDSQSIEAKQYLRKQFKIYKESYDKFFSDKFINPTDVFSAIASDRKYGEIFGYDVGNVKSRYGIDEITSLKDTEAQVKRIIEFFNTIDAVIKTRKKEPGYDKNFEFNRLLNLANSRAKRVVKDRNVSTIDEEMKAIENGVGQDILNRLQGEIKEEIKEDVTSLDDVISKLEEIRVLLGNIASENGLGQIFNNVITKLDEFIDKINSIDGIKLSSLEKNTTQDEKNENVLFEESSGQLAFFDGLLEKEEEIQEEIKETNEQIEGQLSLFDMPSSNASIITKKDAITKLREELNLSQKEADEFINTNFEKVGNKFNIPIEKLDELIDKQKEVNANTTDLALIDTSETDFALANDKVEESAKNTAVSVEKETDAIKDIAPAAQKGSKAKENLAKANKELANTAIATTGEINSEIKEMTELSTIDIDKNSDSWEKIYDAAHAYGVELGEIVSIQEVLNAKTGQKSYKIKDNNGSIFNMSEDYEITRITRAAEIKKAYDDVSKALKDVYTAQSKINSGKGGAKVLQELSDAQDRLANAEQRINVFRENGIELQKETAKIEEQRASYEKQLAEEIDANNQKILNANNEAIKKMRDSINLRLSSDEYTNNNRYKDLLQDLLDEINKIDPSDTDKIKDLNDSLKDLLSGDISKDAKSGLLNKVSQLRKRISDTISKNTKMSNELRGLYMEQADNLDAMLSGDMHYTREGIRQIRAELDRLDTQMVETGQNGASMWSRIGNRLTDMNSKLIAQYLSWQDWIRYIRSAFNTIRELDTALVDLRKTTSMTTEEMDEFYYASSDIAQQTGVTTQEIISQAAAWSRLGYSSKEAATEMAALSSQFAQISPGMSVETATDGLVSSMKAFGFEVDEVERNVMDNINRIGNTMATTNEEIVNMLERSSAAMSAANNTIEETIALESAAVQVTRNAETTGTAFRTISMRIRGYDEETEELSDEYENLAGKIADLTKTAKTPGGISLFTDKDKTTFKSTYQLLKDISEIWDELTDKEQAQLTEKLAGKRGGQVLSAIMNDFSEVERAMTEMSNAAGSSDKEMEIIQESIDYKLNAIKQSWVGFMQDVLKREDIGKLFDSLLKGSESLQKTLSELIPIISPLIEALAELISKFADLNESTNGIAGLVAMIYGIVRFKGKLDLAKGIIGLGGSGKGSLVGLTSNITNLIEDFGKLKTLADLNSMSMAEFAKTIAGTEFATSNFSSSLPTLITGLKSVATKIPAIAAAAAAVYTMYRLNTAPKKIIDEANKINKEYKDRKDLLEDYRDKIISLRSVIDDDSSSLEDQQTAREELMTVQEEMITMYGNEASNIQALTSSVDGLSSAFDGLMDKDYDDAKRKLDFSESLGFFEKLTVQGAKAAKQKDKYGYSDYVYDSVYHHDLANDAYSSISKMAIGGAFGNGRMLNSTREKIRDIINPILNEYGIDLMNSTDVNLYIYKEALEEVVSRLENRKDKTGIKAYEDANKELERIEKILTEDDTNWANTQFEHDVVSQFKDYYVKIEEAKKELQQAQVEGAEELVEQDAGKIIQLYNDLLKAANNDQNIKQYTDDFISDIQGVLDQHAFNVKLQVGDISLNTIQKAIDSYDVDKETVSYLANSSLQTDNGDISKAYGSEYSYIVQEIRKIAEKNNIPIQLVVDKLDIPSKLVKDLEKKLGKNIKLFSKKDLEDLTQIDGIMEMGLKDMQQALIDFQNQLEKPINENGIIDQLTNMTDGFDKLDEIYADILDGGGFDFTKLSTKNFEEAFKGLDNEYQEFIKAVSANPKDISKTQEAFDNLATAFIDNKLALNDLSEADKQVAIDMLKTMGIENAEEVVLDRVAQKQRELSLEKEFTASTSIMLANATMSEIDSFVKEENKSAETRQELAKLALEKSLVNGTVLNFEGDIRNLYGFVEALGGSISVLQEFNAAKKGLERAKSGFVTSMSYEDAVSNAEARLKKAEDKANSYIRGLTNTQSHVNYSGGKSTQAAIDKANKSGSESREILDWIEVAITRIQEEVTRLGKIVSATYRNWSSRNSAIVSEMAKVREEIQLQASAYQAYLREAEKIPLSENYKKLVREGGMFSEEITDKDLKKRIDEYKDLYNKAIAAKDAVEDLNAQIAQLAKTKFDNIVNEFDGYIADIEQRINYINNVMSNVETRNKIAGKSFYEALAEQEKKNSEQLKKELSSLAGALQDAISSGAIEYGSEEFNNMKSKIYDVEEAIQESNNKLEEFKQKMKEVAKLDFDNLAKQFENAVSLLTNKVDFANSIVDAIEASGHIASIKFYQAMIDGANAQIAGNKKELDTLQKRLAEAMSAGDVEKYDEQWYEMNNTIQDVQKSILDAANSVIQFANAMRQVQWDLFDRMQKGLSTLNDEAEYFISMFEYEDIFDKESGALTDYGMATQALYVQRYQTYRDAAQEYANEIKKINAELANDPSNTTLLDRYDDLLHSFWDATKAAEEEKEAIEDLVSNGFDKLRDSIMDIIDRYKDALKAKKDLYDYENTIEEQTGNINSLQKQLLAYSGDDSEETRATIQKLSSDLIKAQKQLEETEYDKYISDQEKMLDDFADSLEEWLNGRLDDVNKLLEDAIAETNANASTISNTIISEANRNSGVITTEMLGIWESGKGYMATTNSILDSTDYTCADISNKIDLLPTNELVSEYFTTSTSSIVSELTNVEHVTSALQSTITETNVVLYNIKSIVEEFKNGYSSVIDNLGRNVVNAINAKQLSVSVSVSGGSSSTSTSGGGKSTYTGTPTTTTTPTVTRYKVTNMSGTYDTAAQANTAARAKIEEELQKRGYYNNNLPLTAAQRKTIKDSVEQKYQVVRAKHGSLITSNASNIFDILAESIGEDHMVAAKEGERVLTKEQNRNFEKLADNEFTPIDDDLKAKFDKLTGVFESKNFTNFVDSIAKIDTPNFEQPTNNNSINTTIGDVSINLPNVTNKQEFVSWLKNDGQIEKIIQAMTLSKMTGGNSYDKLRF